MIKVRNDLLFHFNYWYINSVYRAPGTSEKILSWRKPDGLPLSGSQLRCWRSVHSHTTQQPCSPLAESHWQDLLIGSVFRYVDTNVVSSDIQTIHFHHFWCSRLSGYAEMSQKNFCHHNTVIWNHEKQNSTHCHFSNFIRHWKKWNRWHKSCNLITVNYVNVVFKVMMS